jgi:archaellum component FlaF (FlaF/FlaG flagellin family)
MLKKFVYRAFIFLIIAFMILSAESWYSYFTKSYEETVNGNEVYLSIHKSHAKKKVRVLIIGDSVGKQLYDNLTFNGDIYSLACNQSISMAGQYMLLKTFIDENRSQLPDSVVFIFYPGSLANNLDQVFSFHYFLKPFYNNQYKSMLTDTCIARIHKIPFYYLAQLPFIVNTNWSPTYIKDIDTSYNFISPISRNYLLKIKALCISNHLKIKIVCPPTRLSRRNITLALAKNEKEIRSTGLKSEFDSYFKEAVFLPDNLYKDLMHFKKQYIPNDYYHLTITAKKKNS